MAITPPPEDGHGDEVEVGGQPEALTHQVEEGALAQAPVAHPGELLEAPHADPVPGALVAEQLPPTTDPHALPCTCSVADRSRAADDVDAVERAEGAGPSGHHVVAAGEAVVTERGALDLSLIHI